MRWNAIAVDVRQAACPGPRRRISKLFWGTWHRELGELMIDLLGADGHDRRGTPCRRATALTLEQKLFLFSRADTIYGGSNEIQRNVLGERVLGLPQMERDATFPRYVPGHGLLAGKRVLVTAAAGYRNRVGHGASAASRRARPS